MISNIFSVSWKTQVRVLLFPTIMAFVGLIIANLFFAERKVDFQLRVWISIGSFFVVVFPTYLLHIRYLMHDKSKTLLCEGVKYTLMNRKRKIYSFTKDNIKDVKLFKRNKKSEKESKINWYTWSNYYYLIIFLENGDKICVSSLMFNDIKCVPFEYTIVDKSYPIF